MLEDEVPGARQQCDDPRLLPHHGFRTFLVLWLTQSLSVIGSGMTGFALNVYLAQTLLS